MQFNAPCTSTARSAALHQGLQLYQHLPASPATQLHKTCCSKKTAVQDPKACMHPEKRQLGKVTPKQTCMCCTSSSRKKGIAHALRRIASRQSHHRCVLPMSTKCCTGLQSLELGTMHPLLLTMCIRKHSTQSGSTSGKHLQHCYISDRPHKPCQGQRTRVASPPGHPHPPAAQLSQRTVLNLADVARPTVAAACGKKAFTPPWSGRPHGR